jgi:hypothetical protein
MFNIFSHKENANQNNIELVKWLKWWSACLASVRALSSKPSAAKKKNFVEMIHRAQNNNESPFHPNQNGYHEENKQQMLVRLWGK